MRCGFDWSKEDFSTSTIRRALLCYGTANAGDGHSPRRWAPHAPILIRLVIGGGSIPVLIGIVVGLSGSMALAQFIQAMLYAIKPIDGTTLVGVSTLFLAVALAACFVPAWRAARVDPMTALRQE